MTCSRLGSWAGSSDSRSSIILAAISFCCSAAHGDLFATILAVLAIWSLFARTWFATSMVCVWGAVDLLVAF
jgi:hypothetical protein